MRIYLICQLHTPGSHHLNSGDKVPRDCIYSWAIHAGLYSRVCLCVLVTLCLGQREPLQLKQSLCQRPSESGSKLAVGGALVETEPMASDSMTHVY